jgi:hypothetical protein
MDEMLMRILYGLPERGRCEIIDSGAFNDIITGYVVLAFETVGVDREKAKVMSVVLDMCSALDALNKVR